MFARTINSTSALRLTSMLRTIPMSVSSSVPIHQTGQLTSLNSHPFSSPLTSISFTTNYVSSYRPINLSTSIPNPISSPTSSNPLAALATGKLVSDTLVSTLLDERLARSDCKTNGWVLDGYPRTAKQAIKLTQSKISKPQLVVEFVINREHVQQRLESRRRDPITNKTYNINNLPDDQQIRQRLIIRPDDKPEIIQQRFRIYDESIPSIKQVFTSAGVPIVQLVTPTNASPQQVFKQLQAIVNDYQKVVLMGAPGCGKGTQGILLNQHVQLAHISTGDLLREAAMNTAMSVTNSTSSSQPHVKYNF